MREDVATLKKLSTGQRVLLAPTTLVGRAAQCDVQILSPHVSGQHATLRWSGAVWQVRDLRSRNGTRHNNRDIADGAWHPLSEGDVLCFGGDAEQWRLTSAAPPSTHAVPLGDGKTQLAVGGLLLLPNETEPVVAIQQTADGWVRDDGTDLPQPVADQQVVSAAGVSFRLHIADTLPQTVTRRAAGGAGLHLRFEVSQDEEYIHLFAVAGGAQLDLGSRVHHETLLVLARQRLSEAGEARAEEAGWVYQDDLLRMLAVPAAKLNMDIFRARRQFAATGVLPADTLIERRRSTRQLRIGVASLAVVRR